MKKNLNKAIKKAIKDSTQARSAEEAVLFSQVLINLMNAKQVASNIKSYA